MFRPSSRAARLPAVAGAGRRNAAHPRSSESAGPIGAAGSRRELGTSGAAEPGRLGAFSARGNFEEAARFALAVPGHLRRRTRTSSTAWGVCLKALGRVRRSAPRLTTQRSRSRPRPRRGPLQSRRGCSKNTTTSRAPGLRTSRPSALDRTYVEPLASLAFSGRAGGRSTSARTRAEHVPRRVRPPRAGAHGSWPPPTCSRGTLPPPRDSFSALVAEIPPLSPVSLHHSWA